MRRSALALERVNERGERVVALAAPVVDEIQADVAVPLRDLVQGLDLARVHDRGIEAGLHAFVQEDRVEQLSCRGGEPEGHVREADHRMNPGQLGLDPPDRLDRLDAISPALLHAGRQRESEWIEEQVCRLEAIAPDREVVNGLGRT